MTIQASEMVYPQRALNSTLTEEERAEERTRVRSAAGLSIIDAAEDASFES